MSQKHEWQRERIEMTRQVWQHILDPIMTFAELVRGYNHEKGVDCFTPEEISAVLRLLVMGGYTETKTYCTFGGSFCHFSGDLLEQTIRNWDAGAEGGAE
jgi:hypothetical protein